MHLKKGKAAGRKESGDIVVDLGEKIDAKLRSAQAGREKLGASGVSRFGYRPGTYRPGMYGGSGTYRPWFAQQKSGLDLGRIIKMPAVSSTNHLATGAVVGIAANRALARLVPMAFPAVTSKLAVDAINFGLGLIPLLAKPNSLTMGVALPGLVFLGGDLADMLLDAVGLRNGVVAPPAAPANGGMSGARAARERLQAVQQRLAQSAQRPVPRVVAQPAAFAG